MARMMVLVLCMALPVLSDSWLRSAAAQARHDLSYRVQRLEMDLQEIQRQLFAPGDDTGTLRPEGRSGADNAASREWAARAEGRLQQIEEQLRRVTGQLDSLQHELQDLVARIEAGPEAAPSTLETGSGKPDSDTGLTPQATGSTRQTVDRVAIGNPKPGVLGHIRTGTRPADGAVAFTPARNLANLRPAYPDDPQERYSQAFGFLLKHNYAEAEAAFRSFVEDHADTALAGNALYWLGETHYVRQNYADAAATFANGYEKYPDGPKTADNLVKLAMSLARMDRGDDACVALAQFEHQFPNAAPPLKHIARQESTRISCG